MGKDDLPFQLFMWKVWHVIGISSEDLIVNFVNWVKHTNAVYIKHYNTKWIIRNCSETYYRELYSLNITGQYKQAQLYNTSISILLRMLAKHDPFVQWSCNQFGIFLTHRRRPQFRELGLELWVAPCRQSPDSIPQLGRESFGTRWSVGRHVESVWLKRTAAVEERNLARAKGVMGNAAMTAGIWSLTEKQINCSLTGFLPADVSVGQLIVFSRANAINKQRHKVSKRC